MMKFVGYLGVETDVAVKCSGHGWSHCCFVFDEEKYLYLNFQWNLMGMKKTKLFWGFFGQSSAILSAS